MNIKIRLFHKSFHEVNEYKNNRDFLISDRYVGKLCRI